MSGYEVARVEIEGFRPNSFNFNARESPSDPTKTTKLYGTAAITAARCWWGACDFAHDALKFRAGRDARNRGAKLMNRGFRGHFFAANSTSPRSGASLTTRTGPN